jgi:hypothetical protein
MEKKDPELILLNIVHRGFALVITLGLLAFIINYQYRYAQSFKGYKKGSPCCFVCGRPAEKKVTQSYARYEFQIGSDVSMWLCSHCKPPVRLRAEDIRKYYEVDGALSRRGSRLSAYTVGFGVAYGGLLMFLVPWIIWGKSFFDKFVSKDKDISI